MTVWGLVTWVPKDSGRSREVRTDSAQMSEVDVDVDAWPHEWKTEMWSPLPLLPHPQTSGIAGKESGSQLIKHEILL